MKISITINDHEVPQRLEQVFKIVPRDVWCHRASTLCDRERQNPLLGAYFDDRYAIERFLDRALTHWAQHGRLPSVSSGPEGGRYYDLYSFIHILTSVYPRLSPKGQVRVQGYLRSGLQSEDGLAAFAHELSVAVHLWSMGFDVDFTDIEDRARFDILATKDNLHLEVDCKTHSADVGRRIHQRRAIELFHRVTPAFRIFAKPGVGRTVDVLLPGRLRGTDSYINAVASAIRDAIAQNKSLSVPQIADVSLGGFAIEDEPTLFTDAPTADALARIAERLGRTNRHVHWFGSPNEQAAVVASVSSREPDQVVDYIYRQLKKSAERQFSGTNPALIAANLLDLTPEQLGELASGPSELGNIANRLFARPDRAHLFGVAFVSPADMPTPGVDIYGSRLASRGMALLFRRDSHPLSQDPRLALFKPHDQASDSSLWDRLPFWIARAEVQYIDCSRFPRSRSSHEKDMTFQQRKTDWLAHGRHLVNVALEIVGQCDRFDTTKGSRDPKVIALALLARSLRHFDATCRLLEIGFIVEARALTRCIFENLFMQGALAERGDEFVQQMVDAAAKSRQSRGSWVLGWLDEQEGESPYEEGLRETMDKLRQLYPKPRDINFAAITRDGRLKDAYLWYKQLSSDAAHPSLEALTRHLTKQEDGSILLSVEPVASEKDCLDTIEWACQALMGVIVGANQIAGPVKAGEKLPTLCDEFMRLAGVA